MKTSKSNSMIARVISFLSNVTATKDEGDSHLYAGDPGIAIQYAKLIASAKTETTR
jgi:hypothetical protein